MKTRFHVIAFLYIFYCTVGMYAQNNSLSISSLRMSRGAEATMSISMDNDDEIIAIETLLEAPAGFTFNVASATLSERGTDHIISANNIGTGKCKVIIYSPTNAPITGMAGELFTITIKASTSVNDETDYQILLTDAITTTRNGNNVISNVVSGTITIASLPNLHVVSVDCSAPVAGSEMTIKWIVRNDGRGNTGDVQWNDYIWLVPDISGGTSMRGSKLLATIPNVEALAAGQSYEKEKNIMLDERIYGNYDIVVTTDMYSVNSIDFSPAGGNAPYPYEPSTADYGYLRGISGMQGAVLEEGETLTNKDNFFYKNIDIQVPPLADIQVPAIVATVIPTVDLQSGLATRHRIDAIINPAGPTEDELLMPWYEAYIPNALSAAGLRHSNAFYSGKKIKVKVTVANKGGKDTEKSFNTVLYMSSSADPYASQLIALDRQTYDENIPAGSSVTLTFAFYLPYSWFGDTYFHAYADDGDNVYELANIENNWGTSANYNILLCPGADFVPRNLAIPSTVGQTFNISYKVQNLGAGVPYSNTWKDNVYISTSPDGLDSRATLIGTVSNTGRFITDKPLVVSSAVSSGSSGSSSSGSSVSEMTSISTIKPEELIYKGDNYDISQNITIPNPAPGKYYIYVKVDGDDDIFEYDGEDNNVICKGPISVTVPDLTATLRTLSMTGGQSITASWTLNNIGNGHLTNAEVTDDFYASTTPDGTNLIPLGTVKNIVSIASGGFKTLRANIALPNNSQLSGQLYVFVKTNSKKTATEADYENNKSNVVPFQFEFISKPNIEITNVAVPDRAEQGQQFNVSYNIRNSGNTIINDIHQEAFISDIAQFDINNFTPCSVSLISQDKTVLQPGETTSVNMGITIPSNIQGGYKYLYIILNRENQLAEKTTSDNVACHSIYLTGNLPDFTISDLFVPETIRTSQPTELSWTLNNTGQWSAPESACRIYLSQDANLDRNDIMLKTVTVKNMATASSQVVRASVTIDDDKVGKYYIIVKANDGSSVSISETTASNNTIATSFTSKQAPLPDLSISDIMCNGTLTAGSTATIHAKVTNTGDDATHKSQWSDVVYLSTDFNFDKTKAKELLNKSHVGIVDKDGSYDLTANVNIPRDAHGYYFLYIVTDDKCVNVEKDRNNNVIKTKVYIENYSDKPADLAITSIAAPARIMAGEPFDLTYTIINNGQYAARANLRDVVYLSSDKQWDNDDVLVGTISGNVTLESGNEEIRVATGRVTNVPEGTYYFVVRTNAAHAIAETDYDNNLTIATSATKISFQNIALGETSTVNTSGYYKLNVNSAFEGRTIGLNLTHDSEVPAGLYVAYERVPSTARYDRASSVIQENEQEVLMPDVKVGNYYILAQDNTFTDLNVNEWSLDGSSNLYGATMDLDAREVHFGASSLSIREGGTDGWLTTEIRGALLDSIMDFRLSRNNTSIPVEAFNYNDQTSTYATFNLHNAEPGGYDVVSELPNGTRASLANAFTIVPGHSVNLGLKMELPAAARSYFFAPVSIAYANGGNTDISIKELLVVVSGGIISSTVEGLDDGKRELHIVPDFVQDRRGYISIPPGTQKVINCFIGTSGGCTVSLYIVK